MSNKYIKERSVVDMIQGLYKLCKSFYAAKVGCHLRVPPSPSPLPSSIRQKKWVGRTRWVRVGQVHLLALLNLVVCLDTESTTCNMYIEKQRVSFQIRVTCDVRGLTKI